MRRGRRRRRESRKRRSSMPYLLELLLGGEAEPVHGVGSVVSPLAKLLGCLGERHAGGDGAVDDGLDHHPEQERERDNTF